MKHLVRLSGPFPPVLDVCCSTRMFWFNKADPRAVYVDKQCEVITQDQPQINHQRVCKVDPDHVADFTDLPFPDNTFALVVFDPPHKTSMSATSTFTKFYGALLGDWRDMLRKGFAECFRVLRPDGVLVFKWNDIDVSVDEILALTPEKPLFGHPTRRGALPRKGKPNFVGTHWVAFLKPNSVLDRSQPPAVTERQDQGHDAGSEALT